MSKNRIGLLTYPHAAYDRRAPSLVRRYETLCFQDVHKPILDLVPSPPAFVLDVGAGSGRDAAALARRHLRVFAVEPSRMMRSYGQRIHSDVSITWINDSLPHLHSTRRLGQQFHFILVSAVWMHLPGRDRPTALKMLRKLLRPDGVLVITLRIGRVDPIRRFFAAQLEELTHLASECDLRVLRITDTVSDKLSRPSLTWRTVALAAEP